MKEIRIRESQHPSPIHPVQKGMRDERNRQLALSDAARFQASQLGSAVQTFQPYTWDAYQNNWSKQGALPSGVQEDLGFATIMADGSFDPRFPLNVGSSTGLAVGGWNNSHPGPEGGLYEVLKDPLWNGNLTQTQQTLLDNLVKAAKQNGFQRVTMDFEAYKENVPKETYTKFMQSLGQQLHAAQPPIQLQMAISPSVENQDYYDLPQLLKDGSVDKLQVMCYDYATDSKVGDNADVTQTTKYLNEMLSTYEGAGLSREEILHKLDIGVPMYGKSWTIQPGLSIDDIRRQIDSGSLTGAPATGNDQEYGDDKIRGQIQDWDNPAQPWQKILAGTDGQRSSTYYYNPTTGQILSAFPPQSMNNLAIAIHDEFPQVAGFFSWQSADDLKGEMYKTMMQAVMNQEAPPDLQTVKNDGLQYLQQMVATLPKGSEFSKQVEGWIADFNDKSFGSLSDIKTWFQQKFLSVKDDKDLYMQYPELFKVSDGKVSTLLSIAPPDSLLYLEVGVQPQGDLFPPVTDADVCYAGILGLEKDYPSQKPQLEELLQRAFFPKDGKPQGSERLQTDISQFYWWPFNEGKGDGQDQNLVISDPALVAALKHVMCPGQA